MSARVQFENGIGQVGAKLSFHWPFFSSTHSTIAAAAMCTVALNVLEPGAFNAERKIFKPLFNKIS
jgi:hypothetical protein